MINTVSKRVKYINAIEYLISDATDEDLCGQILLLSALLHLLLHRWLTRRYTNFLCKLQ